MQQITLKIGNVIDKLKTIPTESVDCIITSPPYYCLRKYKAPDVVWGGDPNCEHEWIEQLVSLLHDNRNNLVGTQEEVHNASGTTFIKKYDSINAGKCSKCSAWSGQLGLEPDYHMYLDHLLMITAELKRVLKPTGTLWWNMGDSYNGNKEGKTDKKVSDYVKDAQDGLVKNASSSILIKSLMQLPTRFAIRMADEQNWILRNNIIWHKRNHMPSSVKDRLTNSYESIFFFTKQKRYFFNLDAIRVPNKVMGVTDMRPPGILRQKLYKSTRYLQSNDPHLSQFKTKQDLTYNRIGFYTDPLYTKPLNPLGKNPGDVLELSTQPFKGAHFAVFTPKLPEFCIKAGSPEEVCSVCGKPKMIKLLFDKYVNIKNGDTVTEPIYRNTSLKYEDHMNLSMTSTMRTKIKKLYKQEYVPVCVCNADFKPSTVLDPFAGSGTTLMVARQLGRSAIGIEISEEYTKIIKKRLNWGFDPNIEWKVD